MFQAAGTGVPARIWRSAVQLLQLAGEAVGVVRAAYSFIDGYLWVGAQGASHVYRRAGDVLGDDGLRGFACFAPAFDHTHFVELVGTVTAAAVSHAGLHVELEPVVLFLVAHG